MTLRNERMVLLALMLVIVGCFGFSGLVGAQQTSPVSSKINENWPVWLKEAMIVEVGEFKPETMVIEELGVTMKTPFGASAEMELGDGAWYLPLKFETSGLIECYLFFEEVDFAHGLVSMADYMIDVNVETFGEVSSKQLFHLDAGSVESRPFLSLEWLYTMGKGSEARVQLLKGRMAIIDEYALYCFHHSVGYRASFDKAFEFMVQNIDFESRLAEPYFTEISKVSINGSVIGFNMEVFTLDSDGDTEILTALSTLIPATTDTLMKSDRVSIEYSTPDGRLINMNTVEVENDSLKQSLAFGPLDPETWEVSGELRGKEFQQSIKSTNVVSSNLKPRLVYHEFAASGEAGQSTEHMWMPSVFPGALSSIEFALVNRPDESKSVEYSLGPMNMTGELDAAGNPTRVSGKMANQTILVEVIWSDGQL